MNIVQYCTRDGIAHIRLNRPEKLNALSDDMYGALFDALYQFNDDQDAQIGIISGNGRAFCSGADVKQRQLKPKEEIERLGGFGSREARLETAIFRAPVAKPLIAAVHGYAFGAGLKLALYCDLIVASKGTKFQITETSRGVNATLYWMLLTQRGAGTFANDVALTGRVWLAEEGMASAVINRLAEPDQHIESAEILSREIAKNPPLAVRAVAEFRRGIVEELESRAYALRPRGLHLSEDFRESALAALEKRKPIFRGK